MILSSNCHEISKQHFKVTTLKDLVISSLHLTVKFGQLINKNKTIKYLIKVKQTNHCFIIMYNATMLQFVINDK